MEATPTPSENQNVGPSSETKTEVIERLVSEFEMKLNTTGMEDARYDELLEQIKDTLALDDTTAPYTLQAFGHRVPVYGGDIDPSLEIIDCAEVYFDDVTVKAVGCTERVGIHYKAVETGEVEWYFVPPAGVISSTIYSEMIESEDNLHPVLRYIRKTADLVLDKIKDSPFYTADIAYQQIVMRDISKELYCDLATEYDNDVLVSIGTDTYYVLPDHPNDEIDWFQQRQTLSLSADIIPPTLEGFITEVVYLEMLSGQPKKINNESGFVFGDGLPCIILSNPTKNTIYFVPAASVRSFYSEADVA